MSKKFWYSLNIFGPAQNSFGPKSTISEWNYQFQITVQRGAAKKRSENQAVINDFGLEESSQHDMKESNSNCIAV